MSILNFKLLGGIVVVATAGMLLACQPNPKANRSALHCVEPTWDIGTVKVKPELLSLSHEFVLTNRSKSLVEIVEVRSTCGFLSVSADEKILPGSELRLRAFVKVLPISGKFRHQILVRWRGLKDEELERSGLRRPGFLNRGLELRLVPREVKALLVRRSVCSGKTITIGSDVSSQS